MADAHFGHQLDYSGEDLNDSYQTLSEIEESESIDFETTTKVSETHDLAFSKIIKILAD